MVSLWKTPVLGPAVFSVWCADARRKLGLIEPWLNKTDRILEIGSGPGSVLKEFRRAGYSVDGLDIADNAFSSELKPTVYGGISMPFETNQYDTALLLTVLHHTYNPEDIIKEASRVARRVIIIEDVFNSTWQRKYTKVADSLTNLQFYAHPHTNQSDMQWRQTFARLGLPLLHGSVHRFALFFLQSVYVLNVGEYAN